MNRLAVFLLLCCASFVASAKVLINDVRVWPSPDSTRIVFDVNKPLNYKLFSLHNPERIVIDIKKAELKVLIKPGELENTQVKRIRHAKQVDGTLRIVLDLQQSAKAKSFTLKPNEQYGNRLVVDLVPKNINAAATKASAKKKYTAVEKPQFVIALDAGHGGEDPGAIGRNKTREKDVVLQIARKLYAKMKKEKALKPVLIRQGDYYIGLRKRMDIARKASADLFVSIHADAFKDHRARGSSVYVLSSHGASNEAARWLAERENRADLIGGISLDDKDDLLASVLLDLSQAASSQASYSVGGSVLRSIGGITKLHSRRVQKAGFAVLKSPDVPSILIETGFISNPVGEKNLRSSWFQQRMAGAILKGIKTYYKDKPLPKLHKSTAKKKSYTISRGDTLSKLSKKFGLSVKAIKDANDLNDDHIVIGQKLEIPEVNHG